MRTLPYLGFHLLFVLPPLVLLARALPDYRPERARTARVGLALMATAAFLYTTPWDNFLIEQGVWWYGDGVVAARVGAVPLGEYLFFVLQTVLTAFWLHVYGFDPSFEPGDWRRRPRVVGAGVFLAATALGAALVLAVPRGYYLGAILVWACPLLALQWGVGGGHLARTWRRWGVAVAVPTLYLWFADRVAIGLGVWVISEEHTTGVELLGLPVEEATFFLVTNLLVVSGLVLFEWVIDWWR
ncbi:MAG: lycopene cyclase domain-containing protein [Haloferacaceae archaeon]